MGEYSTSQLDELFGALADPTRRAILDRLANGEARVTDIAAGFPISLNSVSKHLRMLERAGLVVRNVHGREHVLTINAEPIDAAAQWIGHHRQFWEASLGALEDFVTRKPRKANNRSSRK